MHLQWDDPWMIVTTAVQTIPRVFTWDTWIALPVSTSHIVKFPDVCDSLNYNFFYSKRTWEWKLGEFVIQNHIEKWKVTGRSNICRKLNIYAFAMMMNCQIVAYMMFKVNFKQKILWWPATMQVMIPCHFIKSVK